MCDKKVKPLLSLEKSGLCLYSQRGILKVRRRRRTRVTIHHLKKQILLVKQDFVLVLPTGIEPVLQA